MLVAITNGKIFTGQTIIEGQTILVQNGKILEIGYDLQNSKQFKETQNPTIIDLKGENIAPGFIDIQINGGKTIYFSEHPEQHTLDDIYETCCEFGTPFILPTIITSTKETIMKAIKTVRNYREKHSGVLGMHLEGPFLNPKKAGAHKKELIRKPTNQQLQQIIEQGKDVIKVITIAPECLTQEQLDMLIKSGIIVSIGHSDINYQQAQHYFSRNISLVTHLYNAMNQMGHRECGLVGAIFDNPHVYASIILDGGHCHYAAARIAYKVKQDKLILVTDSSFLGRHKTSHSWQGWSFKTVDGFFRDSNGNLSGAAISMPQAFQNARMHLGVSIKQAVEMCTSRVAKAIKMDNEIGFIKKGYPSKFIIFENDMKQYKSLIL